MNSNVRVRFAPSPTGYLHIGGARTALYNYIFAQQKRNAGSEDAGKFILRIEDTDAARSSDESLRLMMNDLKWLGLNWDEGPDFVTLKDHGDYAPYRQSDRKDIYQKYAQELLQSGKAYYCFLTDEELEQQRKDLTAQKKPPHVISPYADWPLEKSLAHKNAGNRAVVRFKTQHLKKDYILQDLIRGEVKFPSDMVGDFVLLRSEGMPVYNFCCVIDDGLMKISHVFRAEEHLSNTLRQMMIYESLGWKIPEFGHMSLILDEDRQKLSKRKGAVACGQFAEEGYLPEAVINFMALLGWSHPDGKEIFSLQELIEKFSTERLNLSGAVFDRVKFQWMNAQYLRALSGEELLKRCKPFMKDLKIPDDANWQVRAFEFLKTSMETLADVKKVFAVFDDAKFSVEEAAVETLKLPESKKVIQAWLEFIKTQKDFLTTEQFVQSQENIKNSCGVKGKSLFMPLRIAITGQLHGSDLKPLVPFFSVSSLLERAEKVLAQT